MTSERTEGMIPLPPPLVDALSRIENAGELLGEIRCVSGDLVQWLAGVRETDQAVYTAGHLAVELLLAAVQNLAADHPHAVPGAIEPANCRCGTGASLRQTLQECIAAARTPQPIAPPPASHDLPGMYL